MLKQIILLFAVVVLAQAEFKESKTNSRYLSVLYLFKRCKLIDLFANKAELSKISTAKRH